MKWFIFSWRNVMRNRRRTLLTMAIFSMGTAAILCSYGFITASFHGLREATISSQVGHLQIGVSTQFDGYEDKPLGSALTPEQRTSAQKILAETPHVRYSMQRLNFEGLIAAGDRTLAILGSGIESELETRLSGAFAQIVEGDSLPAANDIDQMKILIAVDLAKALGVKPRDRVTLMTTTQQGVLNRISFMVCGIYQTGIPELDRRAILIPLTASQTLLDTQRISRVVVVLDKTVNTQNAQDFLTKKLNNLKFRTWYDLAPFYRQVVSLYSSFFRVLGIIIASVVLLSASNAMLMSVMERVREQGTLRAFGISAQRILRNSLTEGAMVGFLGAVLGLGLATMVSIGVSLSGIQMPPPPGRTTAYPLLIFIEPTAYAWVTLAMTLVGIMAAGISQFSIRRMTILEQLNHV
jgi:putative ABC transport system permease protein